jgi:hypothetical protein
VDLTWLGARRLLGLPLDELAYRSVAVDDLWGRDGRLLLDRLAGTSGPGARLNLVEAFLRLPRCWPRNWQPAASR